MESNRAYELRESPPSAYGNDFTDKTDALQLRTLHPEPKPVVSIYSTTKL